MLKSNELRVGNYVMYGNEFTKVESIFDYNYINEDLHFTIPLEDCIGIELTEEILLNVKGIKEKKGRLGKYYYLEPYSLLRFFFDKNKLVVIKEDFNKSIWLQEVEYLHQFQNIIFALTNKELEINL